MIVVPGGSQFEKPPGAERQKWYTHFPNHADAAGPNQTIDYFFLSPDTQLINSYVRQRDTLHISDHLPLVAEFQIPRKQGRAP